MADHRTFIACEFVGGPLDGNSQVVPGRHGPPDRIGFSDPACNTLVYLLRSWDGERAVYSHFEPKPEPEMP